MPDELPPLPREYTQVILSTGDELKLASESYEGFKQAITDEVTHWLTVDYWGGASIIAMDSVASVTHVTAAVLDRWEQEQAAERARAREEAKLRAIYGDDYEPDTA